MNIYISTERSNTYFINAIKSYCNSSQKHRWIFLPDIPCNPGEVLSTRIIKYISSADLIFMDLTPQEYLVQVDDRIEHKYFTNAGIIIEYSVAISLGRIEDMKVYCLTSADNLHQVLRERIVDPYPRNDEASFIRYIDDVVSTREQDSLPLLRQSRVNASLRSLYADVYQS